MPLFTDGPVASMEDLTAQDSQLLTVANVEGIDVTQKLAVTQDQLALDLQALLERSGFSNQPYWITPAGIDSIVATPALKQVHILRTLEAVYDDAFGSQLNDRYAGKRDQYHLRARQAFDVLIQLGLGIATDPLPRAAQPRVVPAAGLLPDNTYYFTMAWTNSAGAEGAAAVPDAISTTGTSFLVQPGPAPKNATGWNFYAGTDPAALQLQNPSPIASGDTWLQPATITTGGRAPGTGQAPTFFKPVARFMPRG